MECSWLYVQGGLDGASEAVFFSGKSKLLLRTLPSSIKNCLVGVCPDALRVTYAQTENALAEPHDLSIAIVPQSTGGSARYLRYGATECSLRIQESQLRLRCESAIVFRAGQTAQMYVFPVLVLVASPGTLIGVRSWRQPFRQRCGPIGACLQLQAPGILGKRDDLVDTMGYAASGSSREGGLFDVDPCSSWADEQLLDCAASHDIAYAALRMFFASSPAWYVADDRAKEMKSNQVRPWKCKCTSVRVTASFNPSESWHDGGSQILQSASKYAPTVDNALRC